MNTLTLGRTGRRTTRLGFGCGSVMGVLGWTDSMRMLETAFEAGIRHFDVAPAYGYGEAERCLGAFARRYPGQLTVATKFGIPAASGRSLKGVARKFARPLLKAMPSLKASLPAVTSAVAHAETFVSGPNPIFTTEQARRSIDASLSELKTDRIDLLLLHEARAIDLNDDGMLRLLEDFVAAGKIGDFGIGSEKCKLQALLEQKSAYCHVLQYEWSVVDPMPQQGLSFRLHHRSMTRDFSSLHAALVKDVGLRTRWSEACGLDVGDAGVLASLMLKAAMLCNPESVILFSSKQPTNITRNAKVADNREIDQQALRFYSLVRAERPDHAEVLGDHGRGSALLAGSGLPNMSLD